MFRIRFTNEIGGKKSIAVGMVMVSVVMSFIILMLFLHPDSSNQIGIAGTILLTGITAIILFLTLQTYVDLLKVSELTLSFTKTQTSYNSYFDNYKLFFELSKIKTDKLVEGKLDDDLIQYFDKLTFNTIQFNYLKILELVPSPKRQEIRFWYDLMFKRFNYKVQSFIDILTDEIEKINADSNLSYSQKTSLINLYKNFIMNDYINLCRDLIKNRRYYKENPLESGFGTNLLKCNEYVTIFDLDRFLRLHNELEKDFTNSVN